MHHTFIFSENELDYEIEFKDNRHMQVGNFRPWHASFVYPVCLPSVPCSAIFFLDETM